MVVAGNQRLDRPRWKNDVAHVRCAHPVSQSRTFRFSSRSIEIARARDSHWSSEPLARDCLRCKEGRSRWRFTCQDLGQYASTILNYSRGRWHASFSEPCNPISDPIFRPCILSLYFGIFSTVQSPLIKYASVHSQSTRRASATSPPALLTALPLSLGTALAII